MANRSNRRRMSLSRVLAFEAVIAIRPRRADAHHGQEAPPSTNRSDIRAQSHLVANRSMRSRQPRSLGSILMPNPKREGRSIDRCAECHELSTAARPPACQRGAQSAGRPWITLRLTLGCRRRAVNRDASLNPSPSMFPLHFGEVHIHPTCSVPDDHIDKKRYPLFLAREVLSGLIDQLRQGARGAQLP